MARNLPRCRDCRAPIAWYLSPFTGKVRKFDARPVDGRTHTGAPAYPVEGRRAWKFTVLVDDLQVRRECSRDDAEAEAYDMPWHVAHDCPNNPHTREDSLR
jgi:hypothetical protein